MIHDMLEDAAQARNRIHFLDSVEEVLSELVVVSGMNHGSVKDGDWDGATQCRRVGQFLERRLVKFVRERSACVDIFCYRPW